MAKYLADERMNIALGRMPKVTPIHKFGARTGVATTTATIWDDGLSTYPWSVFNTAGVVTVTAANAADNSRIVTVVGLDANFDSVTETITMSGGVGTGTVQFKRVFRAYMRYDGANVGEIYIRRNGAGGTIVAQINAGNSQTLMCVYTVPRNHTGLILKGVATCSADKDMIVQFFGRFLEDDGVSYTPFRIQHQANIYQNNYTYEFAVPLALPEKTDLDVRVLGYSNDSGAHVSAAFDMVLYEVDTDY